MAKFRKVTFGELDDLKCLLMEAGSSVESFRYYQKRSFEIIKNHKITVLLSGEDGQNVAYGHIDFDGSKHWLGIMVKESNQGQGWGKKMMSFLTDFCDQNDIVDINLTVDKNNIRAISLYDKFDFVIVSALSDRSYLMIRHKKL